MPSLQFVSVAAEGTHTGASGGPAPASCMPIDALVLHAASAHAAAMSVSARMRPRGLGRLVQTSHTPRRCGRSHACTTRGFAGPTALASRCVAGSGAIRERIVRRDKVAATRYRQRAYVSTKSGSRARSEIT